MGHSEFLELNYGLNYKAQDSGFQKEKLAGNSGIRVALQGTNGKVKRTAFFTGSCLLIRGADIRSQLENDLGSVYMEVGDPR